MRDRRDFYSNELYASALANLKKRKDFNEAPARTQLDMLLKECERLNNGDCSDTGLHPDRE